MGQIVGLNAKCKRANLNALGSILTIPALGEYILVSLDNSMTEEGQGNFDGFIVGDGVKPASELEIQGDYFGTAGKVLDTSQYATINGLINTNRLNWQLNYAAYTCVLIPVLPMMQYEIVAKDNVGTEVIFLTNNEYANSEQAHIADGESMHTINAGGSVVLTAPNNANYLYVLTNGYSANSSRVPKKILRIGNTQSLKERIIADEDKTNFIAETSEDGFFVVDEGLNIGLSITEKGANAYNLLNYEIIDI